MPAPLKIRNETPDDGRLKHELTAVAFAALAISDHIGLYVVDELRQAKAPSIFLVDKIDAAVLGHIASSPVTMPSGTITFHRAFNAKGPLS